MYGKLSALASLFAVATAQQVGTLTTETHPTLSYQTCTSGGSCTTVQGSVTIDANWRWLHQTGSSTNCYTGNTWNSSICSSASSCASSCALDGADYSGTYGVSTSGNALTLGFVTQGPYSTNIGSRMYLLASDSKYAGITLLGQEFTMDVDVSNLGCGLNGAVYFVSMDLDGGMSKYPTNKAGAKYGTGYCDSQCPRDLKFIDGQANVVGWQPSSSDKNAGLGPNGSCCSEMDIWEANSISTAFTPHPCTTIGQQTCSGDACGGTYSTNRYAGECDPDGCDFNSYRMGVKDFYGPGMTVDTKSKFTVVTQFLESGGALSEIKRFYVQNGKVIPNSQSAISGVTGNSITQAFCDAQKTAFGDTNEFDKQGGLAQMGKALAQPMVLVLSIWDDHAVNMLWLDSSYPTDKAGTPGADRGTCATTSGVPSDIETSQASNKVTYSNIKFGPINSTFASGS